MSKAMRVHPFADQWPMMTDEEIDDLAADIKAHGLAQPIMLDHAGEMIIDGRNRLKACEIAGVEPDFERLNGADPVAYIWSVNAARRHMMKGALAMMAARAHPEADAVGGRGRKGVAATQFPMVSRDKLSHARTILAHAPDLADSVIAGTHSLDAAYEEAQRRRGAVSNESVRLRKLAQVRPDLADAVTEERMSLDQAEAKAKADAEERKQQRWAITMNIVDGVNALDRLPEQAAEIIAEYDPVLAEGRGEVITPARLRNVAAYATALAKAMEKLQ